MVLHLPERLGRVGLPAFDLADDAQRHRLAVLLSVEAERERRRGDAVQRGDGRGQPLGGA